MISKEFFVNEIKELKKELCELREGILKEVKVMRAEFDQMKEDRKVMRKELTELGQSLQFVSDSYEDVKKENHEIMKRITTLEESNDKLKNENVSLKRDLMEESERLALSVDQLEIERRSCNLELHGIPENHLEDCNAIAIDVLKKVTPNKIELENSFRFGKKTNVDGSSRSRPILIKFKNKTTRDNIYKNRSNLKKYNEGGKLFLNENLPPSLKILLGKANKLRKLKSYKFLWSQGGTILVKKCEESTTIAIRKVSDLNKIN